MKNTILIARKKHRLEGSVTLNLACLGILTASIAWPGVPLGKQKTIAPFPCFLFPLLLDLEVVLQGGSGC